MKVITWETLYHEDYGATLKHKCGKGIVTLSLLSFSLIFWAFSFLWPFSLFLFLTWDNALENDDHHTSIYLQLNDYNSILEQSMTLYVYLRRCTGICNEPSVTCMKELWRWLFHKYGVSFMIMQSNMTMMERVIINGTMESCMAIYLGMAMEMP